MKYFTNYLLIILLNLLNIGVNAEMTTNTIISIKTTSGDIKIEQVPHKIDGSLVCISSGHQTPFIAPDMHFVREDTCFEYVCRKRNIPQVCVKSRLKGHNYWHPNKRSGTDATRDDEVFKKYSQQSQAAMAKFLQSI